MSKKGLESNLLAILEKYLSELAKLAHNFRVFAINYDFQKNFLEIEKYHLKKLENKNVVENFCVFRRKPI